MSDLAKGTEIGEDGRGCRRFAGWKGKEGSTASLAIHRLRVFASSQTLQLQASQVRGWQVRSSRGVYEGKEGNAASFYTNSHNPADVALATSHSELAGFRRFRRFWGFAVFAVRSLRFRRIRKVRSRRVRSRRVRSRRQKIRKVPIYRLAEDVCTEEGLQLKDSSSSEGK